MKYSKINIDRAPLTDMDIESGQDFSKVLKGLDKVNLPWYKTTAFVSSSVVIGIGALLVGGWFAYQAFFPMEGETSHPVAEETHLEAAPPLIQPISAEMDMGFSSCVIQGDKDTVIIFDLTQVHIPHGCFVDASGVPVESEVEISYREFHDKYDIIFSGIPMSYDSAGTEYQFESAGMFEIRGQSDGEEVFIADDRQIRVEMNTLNGDSGFNNYVLDEESGEWEYLGVSVAEQRSENLDEIEISPATEAGKDVMVQRDDGSIDWETSTIVIEMAADSTQADAIPEVERMAQEAVVPVEPKKADPKRYQINFDYDSSEFPELAVYDDMLFEVAESNNNFQQEQSEKTWNDIKIRRGSEESSYVLTFVRPGERFSVLCYPVVEGRNMEQAMEQYNAAMKEYDGLQEEARAAREERQKEVERQRAEARANLNVQPVVFAGTLAGNQQVGNMYRVFSVARFGIHNSDAPRTIPRQEMVNAVYADDSDNDLELLRIFLVEENRNLAYSLYIPQRLTYNPRDDYKLIGISANGETYYCHSDDFRTDCSGNRCRLTMKLIKNLDSPSDLNDLMASVE